MGAGQFGEVWKAQLDDPAVSGHGTYLVAVKQATASISRNSVAHYNHQKPRAQTAAIIDSCNRGAINRDLLIGPCSHPSISD